MTRLKDPRAPKSPAMSRRGFLVSTVGTTVAFSFLAACSPGSGEAESDGEATSAPDVTYEPIKWFTIDSAGIVTGNVHWWRCPESRTLPPRCTRLNTAAYSLRECACSWRGA